MIPGQPLTLSFSTTAPLSFSLHGWGKPFLLTVGGYLITIDGKILTIN